jgi:hypothetical protein
MIPLSGTTTAPETIETWIWMSARLVLVGTVQERDKKSSSLSTDALVVNEATVSTV